MVILGVCNANDSGAALIVDGKILAAVNEERFTRKKLTRDFPIHSIEYALRSNGLTVRDVDFVGCGAWRGMDQEITLPRLIEDIYYQMDQEQDETREQVLNRIVASGASDKRAKEELFKHLNELGVPDEKIKCCDHHYSHALTGFYCSPFEESFVYTADARGDFRAVTLWSASRAGGLQLVDFATELTSPGALYGFITKYLGFVPDRHEGKVTGLAAMGRMSGAYDILKKGFFYDEAAGRLRSKIGPYYRPFMSATLDALHTELSHFSKEDVAFSVQKLLEETLILFLMKHLGDKQEASINLCLAGGCMANVKLNLELANLKPIKNVYVFPQMGDGGNALGGAFHAAIEKESRRYFDLSNVYLGPQYSAIQIVEELNRHGLRFKEIDPAGKASMVAEFIAQGKVVGWFQGRMEYGPRALGARSILAQATDPRIGDSLNKRLQRTEFMPFAPVTIPEYAQKCFIGWDDNHVASKFMTICYKCTSYFREKCPAVVHVDDTARPQVVYREENPAYYDVIRTYAEDTGIPAIINTSFNHHEEPIVNSPLDAVESLLKGNVDILVIGDYLVAP